MHSEGVYSHSSFSDSVPSFNGSNTNPYDIISSLPSSYSSDKISPLTPSDSVSGLHHSPAYPSGKDYPTPGYGDISERRLPNGSSTGYPSEYSDEYGIGGVNNGLSFPPSTIQHFQDRLGRFPPDRYNHASGPTIPSHHGPDILRSVAPHATHSFREGGVAGYDDMPHYIGASPHQDVALRMPSVDETLARMKLQGHPIMGTSNDLQTFIR